VDGSLSRLLVSISVCQLSDSGPQAVYRSTRLSTTPSAKYGFFASALHHEVDRTAEQLLEILLESEYPVEEACRSPGREGDHEVQVALLRVESASLSFRRRTEEVEQLYAVAPAHLGYLFPSVFHQAVHLK
jgi:hypothetical protein